MAEIKLERKVVSEGEYTESYVSISDTQLVFESVDIGERAKKYAPTSRDEYEYRVIVSRDRLDILTLELIRDRFTDANDFIEWLKVKNIANEFDN